MGRRAYWLSLAAAACALAGCAGSSGGSNESVAPPPDPVSAPEIELARSIYPDAMLDAVSVFTLVFDRQAKCVYLHAVNASERVLGLWPQSIRVSNDRLVDDQQSVRGLGGGLVRVRGGLVQEEYVGEPCGASAVYAVGQVWLCDSAGTDVDTAERCLTELSR